MALRINRVVFPTGLLLCLLILLSGYGVVGVELLRASREGVAEWWLYLQVLVVLVSPWCIYRNLGGILGTIALLVLAFVRLELLQAVLTAGLGLGVTWFGLRDSDPVLDNENPLRWWEWTAGLGMLGLGLEMGWAVLSYLEFYGKVGWLAVLWLATIASALGVVGTQLKMAEIPAKMTAITLGVVAGVGVGVGWLHGSLVIPLPRFS